MSGEFSMPQPEQEFEMQTVENVTRYEFGVGVIEPIGEVSDAELVRGIDESQKPVEAPEIVCIDRRASVGVLKPDWVIEPAEKQPVREKVSGGILATALYAAKVARWSGFTEAQLNGPVDEQIDLVADFIVQSAEASGEKNPLGAHIADDAKPDAGSTGCGAIDNMPAENGILATHGQEPAFLEKMSKTLGDNFSEDIHGQIVANAAEDEVHEAYASFRPRKFADTVMAKGGAVEALDSSNKQPQIDPDNKRHGHYEVAVNVNTTEGQSNDRDHSELEFFQVDAAPLIKWFKRMAADEAEFSRLLHAGVAFQYAVEYKLAKNLPNVIS